MVRREGLVPIAVVAAVAVAPWLLRDALAQPDPSSNATPEDEAIPDEPPADEPGAPPEVAGSASGAPPAAAPAAPARDGMIRVPGATFAMGSPDPKSPSNERPRHVETVAAFWIDRTEVTVAAYRGCVESHACVVPAKSSRWCTYEAGDPLLPVSCVRWRDAEAFCRAGGKRLPRESEWELAGRGPKGGRYPWHGLAAGCYYASTAVNEMTGRTCTKGPSRVGSHPGGASALGILDMAGNVEEWTSDWYVENPEPGAAPAAGASHVLRGGGWQSPPSFARMTSRDWGSSVEAGPNVGFRCAKND